MSFQYIADDRQTRILCCQCGTSIIPNAASMCAMCLKSTVDITEGIPKQLTVHFCKTCLRYLNPPSQWVKADLESRQLLALLLKKIKGLSKVRLIDASFIWTEPHSRRLKVKLTIQKEVFASTVLQQVFVIEYFVATQQCETCTRAAASNTWKAVVQVRQKVDHKRTFLYLEQLILKHGVHRDTVNIKEKKDGLDFFFASRSHAVKFLDFLQSVIPVRYQTSEQLISTDIHSGSSNYKFTFSCEILPICKDDVVCLPLKVARQLGNISQLCVCYRVGTTTHLVSPSTAQIAEVFASVYERTPFTSLFVAKDLIPFTVLDVEPCDSMSDDSSGKFALSDISVVKNSDFGHNDQMFITKSHLGKVLKVGDEVLGYDLSTSNLNDEIFESFTDKHEIPDVILIKKSYPNRRKKSKKRKWDLQRLTTTEDAELAAQKKSERLKDERDYEEFLRELEEDVEMRGAINMFKAVRLDDMESVTETEIDDGEDDFPEVQLTELVNEMSLNEDLAPQESPSVSTEDPESEMHVDENN